MKVDRPETSAAVCVALCIGKRDVRVAAAILLGAQALALSLPGVEVWIVRVGLRVSSSVPPVSRHDPIAVSNNATVFTLWGTAARLPIGVSINVCALIAFALCLSLRMDRAGRLRADSA